MLSSLVTSPRIMKTYMPSDLAITLVETTENPVVVVGHDMKSEDKCKTPHFPEG